MMLLDDLGARDRSRLPAFVVAVEGMASRQHDRVTWAPAADVQKHGGAYHGQQAANGQKTLCFSLGRAV